MTLGDVCNDVKTLKDELADNLKDPKIWILIGRIIYGDETAPKKLLEKIGEFFLSVPDKLFFRKFKEFLNATNLSDYERAKMRAWIVSNENEEDNMIQMLSYIDNAKSLKKIKYFANATRCALNYEIDIETYFEICHAIDTVAESDLKFLSDNITDNYEKPFNQNHHTQKLYSVGLMYFVQVLSSHGSHRFNNFAKLVDICALSFDDDAKYPNRKKEIEKVLSELKSQI